MYPTFTPPKVEAAAVGGAKVLGLSVTPDHGTEEAELAVYGSYPSSLFNLDSSFIRYILPVDVTFTVSPLWTVAVVSLNLAVSSVTTINLSKAALGNLSMLMVPDAILEASKLANVVEIVTLSPKSDETLPVTAPDSAIVLAACNLVAVGALSVLRAYLVRSISLALSRSCSICSPLYLP